ncbi:MAG: hypothetical protein A2049_03920 [Elusimicrobia bacterium GWA2_62_23]|nr:MAG: hypothetical protein A2049_03920 [Elusimicrobia bacterium GWA2_62_23]
MAVESQVSVVILTRGRPDLLRACLRSVLDAGKPLEVLAGVDGEDPASSGVLAEFGGKVRAVQLPRMCRGEARNRLAAMARGRWLCFLDDDTVIPEGYFARLEALIRAHPGAAVFGGGQLLSASAGRFEAAVYALLCSPWGSGPFRERFSPVSGTAFSGPEKFILCNLTLDARFLREHGAAFEGHLTSAEENLLLGRLAAAGARMVLSGDLNLVHRRRRGLRAFLRQVFSCGRGRGQITLLSPKGFCAFTLLPPAALAALLAAGPERAALPAAVYAGCSLLAALLSGGTWGRRAAVLPLFPALHGAYAAGWLCGAAEGLFERFFRRRHPGRCYCEAKT